MSKYLLTIVVLLLSCAGVAGAGEAEVKAAMLKKYPDFPVKNVAKSPIAGVWEIYTGERIVYVDDNVNYLLDGILVDTARKANVSEERIQALNFVAFKDLPFAMAIKQVKGNGVRKMAVFTDPDCPYCRQIQKELDSVDNVTIYYFLFPIAGLHPNATDIARSIWCARDPKQAWLDYMSKQTKPKSAACDNPVDKIVAYGRDKAVNGTPTLFFEKGDQRISSTLTVAQLEQFLQGAAQAKP